MTVKIHPLTLREDLLHSFEVRNSRGKWVPADQRTYYRLLTKKVFRKGKYKRVQAFKEQAKFRQVYLETDFKFSAVRIDGDLVFHLGGFQRRFKLDRLIKWKPYEPVNPILSYVNGIRTWAASQGLSVGSFPLMPYIRIVKKNSPINKEIYRDYVEGLLEGEELVGWAQFRAMFLKRYGLGQVWAGDPDSEDIKVYVAYWANTGWREYRNELPRFFVRSMTIKRTDLGEKGEEERAPYRTKRGKEKVRIIRHLGVSLPELGIEESSKEGRERVLTYVLDNAQTSEGEGEERGLNMAPLGIVGWGYGD